ncbi:hypothetical protein Ahy_A05g025212 isoform D [Arachis hypogaea]|uniref:Uncharacterized protein n=1 Tax=Arachis hypogaea TaxID=3818 RepID=A0A445D885_ARAHY|nr:hypothetical protein Ahy_A05g025212 isoform D [Arachis hypogaea]
MATMLLLPFRTLIPSSSSSSNFRPAPLRCSNDRQALFNRIAPVYDNLNDLLSLGQHRIWKRMTVSWAGYPFFLPFIALLLQSFFFS